jgi:hypothetical protein
MQTLIQWVRVGPRRAGKGDAKNAHPQTKITLQSWGEGHDKEFGFYSKRDRND